MDLRRAIYHGVVCGDAETVQGATTQAVQQGEPPDELLNDVLIAAMADVGGRFERREYFVPEMLLSARAMKAGVQVLRPLLGQQGSASAGTVIVGTVEGDIHDIGKTLASMMLEGAAFQVVDLGVDVPPQRFDDAVRDHSAVAVGMSALLTTTMLGMRATIQALRTAGLREQVVVMVGGAPVTERFAQEVGADIYGKDVNSAVHRLKEMLQSRGDA